LIAATLAALLASAYPAFKAARINPVSTLKSE
jgi:ABC-type lipoprotein release transport system permease subunit